MVNAAGPHDFREEEPAVRHSEWSFDKDESLFDQLRRHTIRNDARNAVTGLRSRLNEQSNQWNQGQ
ncbi:MAG: hypothetical protein DMF88_25210 [Acidobacteria bacterium]|nr:MAG: hypothetical protein DMF88_25210 [Acidobacteriota bacterium]